MLFAYEYDLNYYLRQTIPTVVHISTQNSFKYQIECYVFDRKTAEIKVYLAIDLRRSSVCLQIRFSFIFLELTYTTAITHITGTFKNLDKVSPLRRAWQMHKGKISQLERRVQDSAGQVPYRIRQWENVQYQALQDRILPILWALRHHYRLQFCLGS